MSAGEYALDARAAVAALRDRPEVTTIGILGHSMGAAGSLLAAAADPEVDAVIAPRAPADPAGSRARRSGSPGCRSRRRSPGRSPGSRPASSSSPAATRVASVSASHAVRRDPRPGAAGPRHGRRRRAGRATSARLADAAAPPRPDAATETLIVARRPALLAVRVPRVPRRDRALPRRRTSAAARAAGRGGPRRRVPCPRSGSPIPSAS